MTTYTSEQLQRQDFWAEVHSWREYYQNTPISELYRQHKKATGKKNKHKELITALEYELNARSRARRERAAA